ncbi:MAG: porin [Nostocaceae cyanobacterium]|nr:porin [Nostocaceae cyanobacterium]
MYQTTKYFDRKSASLGLGCSLFSRLLYLGSVSTMVLLILGVEGKFTSAAQAQEVANNGEPATPAVAEAPTDDIISALRKNPQHSTTNSYTQAVSNEKTTAASAVSFPEKLTEVAPSETFGEEFPNDQQQVEPSKSFSTALVEDQPAASEENFFSQVEFATEQQQIEPSKDFTTALVKETPAAEENFFSQVEFATEQQQVEPNQSFTTALVPENPTASEGDFLAQVSPAQNITADQQPQTLPVKFFAEQGKENLAAENSTVTIPSAQAVSSTTEDLARSRSVNDSNLLASDSQQQAQTPTRGGETPPPTPTSSTNLPPARVVGTPQVRLQGVYLRQGEDDAARARVSGIYPFSPYVLVGATVDLTTGEGLSDSPESGLSISELYLAASPPSYQNLRFVVGQMDLTSYFDRNSFAKDGATHFFHPLFQTNPALSATAISSRPGALVTWAITENIETKAAVFSSSRNLGDFAFDAVAGELAFRFGNAIVRGTYVNARDAGKRDGFGEIFQIRRDNGEFGINSGDREESYGINGEVFIPSLKLGLFGRYGRYENQDIGKGGDTYSFGLNFLDLFQKFDRLGLGYGRNLSNDDLRERSGSKVPDVMELFYDFRISPNLRLGFTLQGRDEFSETVAGVRIKTEFDLSSAVRRTLR